MVRPDGSIRFIYDRGHPVLDSNGVVYRFVGIATDVTARTVTENALREREQLLESILDNTTAVIYVKDKDGRLLRVNRQYEKIFGLTRDQILGKTDYDLFPKDKADLWRANDLKILECCSGGCPQEFEEVVPQSDGLHTYISMKFPIYDAAGKPRGVGGVSTDITERKRTEAALLLEVTNVLVSNLEVRKLFTAISATIRQVVAHDFASLALFDPGSGKLRVQRLTSPETHQPTFTDVLLPIDESPSGWVFKLREPVVLNRMDMSLFPPAAMQRAELLKHWLRMGVKSACWVPLIHAGSTLGVLVVASFQEDAFPDEKVRLLIQVANQVAVALDNALAFRQIADAMDRLEQQKLYLEDELKTEYNFEEIIGESAPLKRVLKQVETVAPTDATALILGETGTGKELIARAIHNLSPRRERTFVKLNCAAVPSGLLESELFGHERGAFTGAIARKIGRLELAHGGTLLLDEIGDIPLELQPKLLRALQEKEFERLGSTRTIPVDMRLIAATNRDLSQMVKDGLFRRDLFYRLSVFPITLPPLRERKDDIPLLVHYFLQKHAQRSDKPIKSIPPEVMQALVHWSWPGNVRELENLIERAVILSQGSELRVPLSELKAMDQNPAPSSNGSTLEEIEREHIIQVLRETKGVVGGPHGAAAILGLKRTTLNFKMRKLGITREEI
ncbi:MAG: sigma 54-interacting transcriptional regulator [Acidobacteria bacterium]|nr:sigma 54-interacting transcriptional regulator [Acidobacteriota bacterium]